MNQDQTAYRMRMIIVIMGMLGIVVGLIGVGLGRSNDFQDPSALIFLIVGFTLLVLSLCLAVANRRI